MKAALRSSERMIGIIIVMLFTLSSVVINSALAFDIPVSEKTRFKRNATALLETRQFAKLDQQLLQHQLVYETDKTKARPWQEAYEFAENTDVRHEILFAEWIKRSPNSYAARYSRGEYYYARAWQARGEDYINNVPRKAIQEMNAFLAKAISDYDASLQLAPIPLLTYIRLIDVAGMNGDRAQQLKWLQRANDKDPRNVLARSTYLLMLRPQWGGSIDQMRAFVDEAKRSSMSEEDKNRLESYIWRAYARQDVMNDNHQAAIQNYTKAMSLYRKESALFVNRGKEYRSLNDTNSAIRDFGDAIVLDPENTDAYIERGFTYRKTRQYNKALSDLNIAVGLSPENKWAWSNRGAVLYILGKNLEAMADYQKASDLGESWSQYALGEHYWRGKGVATDREKAVQWWRKAAANGSSDAVRELKAHGFLP